MPDKNEQPKRTFWDQLDKGLAFDEFPPLAEFTSLDEQVRRNIFKYMLRKYAAFEIRNADPDPKANAESTEVIPVYYTNSAGEKTDTDWKIHDNGRALLVSRPQAITSEHNGLAEFMLAVKQMVAIAAEKGWRNLEFNGYCPDHAWMCVAEYDRRHNVGLNVTNYTPDENKHPRLKKLLDKAVAKPLTPRPQQE